MLTEGQAGKALQWSFEREVDSLCLDHRWTQNYLTFFNAANGKMVDLCMVTTHTTYPNSWCITKVNKGFQLNVQRMTFISNLEAMTQVHSMSTLITAAAGGLTCTHP